MTYDEVIKTWAARGLGTDPEAIVKVEFYFEKGYQYSEYTADFDHHGAACTLVTGEVVHVSGDGDFGGFMQELAAIAAEND